MAIKSTKQDKGRWDNGDWKPGREKGWRRGKGNRLKMQDKSKKEEEETTNYWEWKK